MGMIPNVMIDRLMALFGKDAPADTKQAGKHDASELQLAAAALLVHAAHLDGEFRETESQSVRDVLRSHFDLESGEVEELLEDASKEATESRQLFGFTRVINNALDPEERTKIIEMLWEVAYADGVVHHYESNLVRRVAGLLHVADRDSGAARKRVRHRLNIVDQS